VWRISLRLGSAARAVSVNIYRNMKKFIGHSDKVKAESGEKNHGILS
jgi:hypothetical protein